VAAVSHLVCLVSLLLCVFSTHLVELVLQLLPVASCVLHRQRHTLVQFVSLLLEVRRLLQQQQQQPYATNWAGCSAVSICSTMIKRSELKTPSLANRLSPATGAPSTLLQLLKQQCKPCARKRTAQHTTTAQTTIRAICKVTHSTAYHNLTAYHSRPPDTRIVQACTLPT
jgi:hypothetical protein